jgi:Holliday junction resolvasome RuvABC ATP-dependent DNA helicase subunit
VTREKALEVMDRFVAMGYAVKLYECDMQKIVFLGPDGETTSVQRQLEVTAVSLDKVDLRALVQVADEFGLDVGLSSISGNVSIIDQPTDAEVVNRRRRHPR